MTRQLQVSARRFHARRLAHALVRRDVAMHDDPLRAQASSLAAGGLVAVVVVAACAAAAVVRPREVPASAVAVMAAESGALYVRVDDTLHPVPNLASARLVVRSAVTPVSTSEVAIARARRGPAMGIVGAPASIGTPIADPAWTVCDGDRTVVAVGEPTLGGWDATRPVLVTPAGEGVATTYLVYDGHRAEVDLRSAAVARALRLDGVRPVVVSRVLLDLVPEVPAITVPHIAGAGERGPDALDGAPIGSVVRVRRAEGTEHFVVLRNGIQPVGEVAADLVTFGYDRRGAPPAAVPPAAIATLPIAVDLPVATFPQRASAPVGRTDGVAVCAQWREGASAASNTVVLSGVWKTVDGWGGADLAQADGDGPNVDAVVISGGVGANVRSAGILGDDGSSGTRFLVSDAGVVFGIRDEAAATSLGLGQGAAAAPWPVLAHLPRGPELSIDAASVTRDGIGTSP